MPWRGCGEAVQTLRGSLFRGSSPEWIRPGHCQNLYFLAATRYSKIRGRKSSHEIKNGTHLAYLIASPPLTLATPESPESPVSSKSSRFDVARHAHVFRCDNPADRMPAEAAPLFSLLNFDRTSATCGFLWDQPQEVKQAIPFSGPRTRRCPNLRKWRCSGRWLESGVRLLRPVLSATAASGSIGSSVERRFGNCQWTYRFSVIKPNSRAGDLVAQHRLVFV